MITYISDTAHYKEVLTRIPQVKRSLWIGTADIKDLYMDLLAVIRTFVAILLSNLIPHRPCSQKSEQLQNRVYRLCSDRSCTSDNFQKIAYLFCYPVTGLFDSPTYVLNGILG
ncbi:MAG: hypothetical protein MJZ55_02200 [Paludibacteraceae bacterium]|nr:hypothetical protein [Paludibacteraceae bacterium]